MTGFTADQIAVIDAEFSSVVDPTAANAWHRYQAVLLAERLRQPIIPCATALAAFIAQRPAPFLARRALESAVDAYLTGVDYTAFPISATLDQTIIDKILNQAKQIYDFILEQRV